MVQARPNRSSRRTFLRQSCLGGAGAALAALTYLEQVACAEEDQKPPNFVFILIDDLGWADLGCYGNRFVETPNIDQFAAGGVQFTSAYAAAPVCSPTRASILTGKYPARLHLTDRIPADLRVLPATARMHEPEWRQYLPLEEETLAEALKAYGYATASIGKWHLGGPEFSPQFQGFDLNIGGSDIGQPASFFWPYKGPANTVPGLADSGRKGEYLTDRLTDEAVQFITANRERPFFLYLSHYAVHIPLMAKPEVVKYFAEKSRGGPPQDATYAAMIKSVDDSVGTILATLDAQGLAENTVVVFYSDNGGLLGGISTNAPLRAGKNDPYEGGIRVPFIMRAPGLSKPGALCDVPVTSTDFFPTLLELAGAPNDQIRHRNLDGVSLVRLLTNPAGPLPQRDLFWHYPHYRASASAPFSCIRSGHWKLIEFQDPPRVELYNLRQDAGEINDVMAQHPERAAELLRRLHAWQAAVGAQMPVPIP